MIDLKFLRENPEIVKQNIKNKFQDQKLPLVDEVIELDAKARATQKEADELRASRNTLSKQIGQLMGQGKKEEAEAVKAQVSANAARLAELEETEKELQEKVTKIMMVIPNIIDPSVPIGKDDSCNVEIEKFGEPVVPDFEIPYHTDIMDRFDGIDLDAAGKVAGNGFYYLMGDIARIHSAVISYARDFMIDRGFTYCVPPFMIRSNVVTGVMSFDEMDAMMYKIEGEDLYLIGTSEHSMIGKFIDTINDEEKLPYTLTSYSPCFRKEKGAHGIEERGVYRIHQFEKQEMIVVCKPEESKIWYDKLWQNTVDLFRSLDIPVRTLECCSGDLADLKVKSCDVEAWSPRQKKYFEVGSCSNLGDAQARRLKIRVKGKDGNKYFAHTLNNTVVAPPRMLIAFLENNLQADGSVRIPEVDSMLNVYRSLTAMPSATGSENATSDNVGAVIVRNGWNHTEARAQQYENMFKYAERQSLSVMLKILRDTAGSKLMASDINIKLPRRQYDNQQSKVQIFAQMLSQSIDPQLAFTTPGLFPDPQAAYEMSKPFLIAAGKLGEDGKAPKPQEQPVDHIVDANKMMNEQADEKNGGEK